MESVLLRVCEQYFAALSRGAIEEVLALFSETAQVNSPLYGRLEARDFYEKLAEDTQASQVDILDVYTNEGGAAAHFVYRWTLDNGQALEFTGVDIFRFDTEGLIQELTIIYDTQHTRTAWQTQGNS